MLTWIGLVVTTVISLINVVKDIRLLKPPLRTARRRKVWLCTNRRPVSVGVLTLIGFLVAAVGLRRSEEAQRDARDTARRAANKLDRTELQVRELSEENRRVYEEMLARISGPARMRLVVQLADTIPWAGIVEDLSDAVDMTPKQYPPPHGYVDKALRETLFPRIPPSSDDPQPIRLAVGGVNLYTGLWTARLRVKTNGFVDSQLLEEEFRIDTVQVLRNPGSRFALIVRHAKEISGIDVLDNLRRRYREREPIVVFANPQDNGRPIVQIREAVAIYCLDAAGRWLVRVPLTLGRPTAAQAEDAMAARVHQVTLIASSEPEVDRRERRHVWDSDPCGV